MYDIFGSFKLSRPATTDREIANFNSNYITGRALDYGDSSSFSFSSTVNDFKFDGITFNTINAVDKYGAQENFIFPSLKLRRKEMWWGTSSHPVKINSSNNSGFMLFGNYVAVKKISTKNDFKIVISSVSTVDVFTKSYNTTTKEIVFGFNSLPQVFTEKDSNDNILYDISLVEEWTATVYNQSLSSNIIVKTLYGEILSSEKIKEVSLSNIVIDETNREIRAITNILLSQDEVDSIATISPNTQKIRVITIGEFLIEKNTDNIPEAVAITNSPTRADLGVSSYIYVDIPYQNGGNLTRSSIEYKVRSPVIPINFSTGNVFIFAIAVEKLGNQSTPDGFKVGIL